MARGVFGGILARVLFRKAEVKNDCIMKVYGVHVCVRCVGLHSHVRYTVKIYFVSTYVYDTRRSLER